MDKILLKKIVSFITAFSLMFALIPGGFIKPIMILAAATDVTDEAGLAYIAGNGGEARLMNDIIITKTDFKYGGAGLSVWADTIIDLNGFELKITVYGPSPGQCNGISIYDGHTLTINDSSNPSTGKLAAINNGPNAYTPNGTGAGINTAGSTLIINNGTVSATGARNGAGIGGGGQQSGGTVIINGGTVTAISGLSAAAIGGGGGGSGYSGGAGGTVIINGGAVIANGAIGATSVGIGGGSGEPSGAGAAVTITGGNVTATGRNGGAAIGGGGEVGNYKGAAGTLNVTGGSLVVSGAASDPIKDGSGNDTYSVTVTVKDLKTSQPIQDALIKVGAYEAKTDATGKTFLRLPEGEKTIAVSKLNYVGDSQTITVSTTDPNLIFSLKPFGVTGVTPSATGAPVIGDIEVSFSQPAKPGTGTVTISGGVGALGSGSLSGDGVTYTIPYSGLAYATTYTLTIRDFEDTQGTIMYPNPDNGRTFTTLVPVPIIGTQPQDNTVNAFETVTLTVSASAPEGSLSYEWFSNTSKTNSGGTPVSGATSANFDAPTNISGTVYYYCEITSTLNGFTNKTTSDAADVTVNKISQSAILITGVPATVTYGDSFTVSHSGGSGTGAVTYSRISGDAVSVNSVTGAVTAVKTGTVTLVAEQASDGAYNIAMDAVEITVLKRQLTATAQAADKDYDGNTTAAVTINLANNVAGDGVTATASGAFADVDAGAGKTVTVTNVTLQGINAGYYELLNPPTTATATINKITPTEAHIDFNYNWVYYNGSPQPIIVTAKPGFDLGEITVSYSNNITAATDVGEYSIHVDIAAKGNYNAASIALANKYKILKSDCTADMFEMSATEAYYSGSNYNLGVSLKPGRTGFGTVTSYYKLNNVEVADIKTVGAYEVYVNVANGGTNVNAINGLLVGTFNMYGSAIPAGDITATSYTGVFDGNSHGITVSDTGAAGSTITYSDTLNGIYTSSSPAFTNAGTHTVYYKVVRTDTNYGPYKGSATVTITKKPLTESMIASIADQTYTGSEIQPSLTITDVNLKPTDYITSYSQNLAIGTTTATATITATAEGNYSGTTSKNFSIVLKTLTANDFLFDLSAVDYNGNAQPLIISAKSEAIGHGDIIAIKYDGLTTAPTNAGTYAVTVDVTEGTHYAAASDLLIGNFTINKIAPTVNDLTFDLTAADYTGSPKTMSVTVKPGIIGIGALTVKYDASATAPTGAGTYAVTAEIAEDTNYLAITLTLGNFTINGINIPQGDITVNAYNAPYDSAAHGISVTDSSSGAVTYCEAQNGSYVGTSPAYTNAGTYTVYYKINRGGNYNVYEGSTTVTITQLSLTVDQMTAQDRVFNGNAETSVSISYSGTINGETVTSTATGTFDDMNVGTGKTVTISNVVVSGNESGNYFMPTSYSATTADITQAGGLSATDPSAIPVRLQVARDYSFDLNSIALSAGNHGARSYAIGTPTDSDSVLDGNMSLDSDGHTLKFLTTSTCTSGSALTVSITISTQNYTSTNALITVNVIDRNPVTIEGLSVTNKDYDGQPISPSGTAIVKDNGTPVSGVTPTYNYESTDSGGYNSAVPPKDAGSYKLTVTVDTADYTGTADIPFTINQKEVVITAENKHAVIGGSMPTFTYTQTGLVSGDSLTSEPSYDCNAADTAAEGTFYIIPKNVAAGNNYTMRYVNGTLTISTKSADCDILSTTEPSGTQITGTNITVTVANSVSSQHVNVNISAGATWKLYSDSACNTEIANQTMSLNIGENTAYIKVTAENGTAEKIYTLTVTRGAAGSGGHNNGDNDSSTGGNTSTGKINGILPYSLRNGIITTTPTEAEVRKLIESAVDGVIMLDCSNFTDSTGIELALDPGWFDGSDKTLKILLPGGMVLTINDENWREFATATSDGKIVITFKAGSAVISMKQDGKEIPWYSFENPLIVALPAASGVMIDKATGKVIPRSWYADGTVYAKVYSTGTYDAKTAQAQSFSDTKGQWMDTATGYMAERGVIAGVGGNLFAPGRNVTRGEFVTMLMRAVNIEPQGQWMVQQFGDAEEGAFYYDALLKAKALGLVNGIGDNMFNPDAQITRQDMFVMLYNAMVKCNMITLSTGGMALQEFTDKDQIAGYANQALLTFVQDGIVGGKGEGLLDPKGTATRAEAAQVIYNILVRDAK